MSQSSQESQDSDIVSDSPLKHHRNGSGESLSAKKKKVNMVEKPKPLGKKTVKDTSQVMRSYLLRCKSVTEEDLEEDLETDAGPDDESADETEAQRQAMEDVVERLRSIGDEINKEYSGDTKISSDLNNLITSTLKSTEAVYAQFKESVRDFCGCHIGGDPDLNSLAFAFYLTRRFILAAKEAGKKVEHFVQFGERFINEQYGEWIEEQGGWGRVLGDGTEV